MKLEIRLGHRYIVDHVSVTAALGEFRHCTGMPFFVLYSAVATAAFTKGPLVD